MSLISSIVSNIKLPKIDFKSSAGFVDTVKNLAKVAGDTFLKPSTDGKGIFQSEVNILGMKLPNPVEILAEKLLGAAGKKVSELGFSTDAIANLFTGGRNVKDVGETNLPTLNDRIKDLSTTKTTKTTQSTKSGKAEAGGGTTSTASTGGTGGSTKATTSKGADYADTIMSKFGGSLDSLDSSINGLINKGGELSQTEMLKLQQQMQKRNELYQMMSQIISMEHETKKSIIQNIR